MQASVSQAREKEPFFTRDRVFYSTLFPLLLGLTLQNLIAYSVNMADNIMLGSYSQNALSGAACVNQVFFIVQQLGLCIGDVMVMLGTQYWGQGRPGPIRRITGIALRFGVISGLVIVAACQLFPDRILSMFTTSPEIVAEGRVYMRIVSWTFLLFIVTNVFMAALRAVKTVRISFVISVISLVINVGINWCLIFGRYGLPEMGIAGAAVGTLAARAVELLVILYYLMRVDTKLCLFGGKGAGNAADGAANAENSAADAEDSAAYAALRADFFRAGVPVVLGRMTWAITTPLQTVILGHLSSDAIAANSVATTFYQYLKVVVTAMASVSGIMIGSAIGRGDRKALHAEARTLCVIDVAIGAVLAALLFVLRRPLLSLYSLNDSAMVLADQLLVIMSFVMLGMSYQMPVGSGIIRGGGDAKFSMIVNNVSVWFLVVPLSLLSAFVWKWPVPMVVLCLQSDQILKGIPIFLRFRSYKWAKKLTRDNV